jgi:putrescine importer
LNKLGDFKPSLQLWQIVVVGLGFMAPTVVFDTFGIVSEITNGHVPAAYLFTALAIMFTAASYKKMVRVFPASGSAYTYVQKTINPSLGFMVGWTVFLDYLFTPMINALICSIYTRSLFPNFPTWLVIVLFLLVTTLANIFSLKFSVSMNTLFVGWQVTTVLIFVGLCITQLYQAKGVEGLFSLQPFYSEDMNFSLLISGASILAFSFLGFDAVTTLAEEAKDPIQSIPKAISLIVIIGGALFVTASYFEQSILSLFPKIDDVEGTSSIVAQHLGGVLFQSLLFSASLTSTFASAMVSQTSASRLLYAMGKDGVLPRKLFGYVHPRFGTPVINIVFIGVIGLTAIFLDLNTATSFITFGALSAFTFVNLSVLVHYYIREKRRDFKSVVQYCISPLIGTSLIVYLWVSLDKHAVFLGMSWAVIGAAYLLVLRKVMKRDLSQLKLDEEQIEL